MVLCDLCPEAGTLRCSSCSESYYCSKVCQKKAWPEHKLLCKTLNDFRQPPLPSGGIAGYIRAIHFPPDEDKPRFVWLGYKDIDSEYMTVDFGNFLTVADLEPARHEARYEAAGWEDITKVIGLNRYLPHTLRVHYRVDSNEGFTNTNESIRKTSDSRSPFGYRWMGPVIVCGFDDFTANLQPKHGVDHGPSDIRHIANFFNTYLFRDPAEVARQHVQSWSALDMLMRMAPKEQRELVQCVRVNCDGDVNIGARPRFEAISIPESHAIFKQMALSVSTRIELSLAMARIPGNIKMWEAKEKLGSDDAVQHTTNSAATSLLIGCNPGDDGAWGNMPSSWSALVGSALVARLDKKPLYPDHIDALSHFCSSHLLPLFQQQHEQKTNTELILKEITKPTFEDFYDTWTEAEEIASLSPFDKVLEGVRVMSVDTNYLLNRS